MNLTAQTSRHNKTIDELVVHLAADIQCGLSSRDATKRLAKVGPNALRKGDALSPCVILASQFQRLVIWVLTAGVALTAFAYERVIDDSVADARNAAFPALVMAELLRSFGARGETRTVWQIGLFTNLRLFLIVVVSFALQLLIHHVPVFETFFEAEPITLAQCVAWTVLGALSLLVLEGGKVWRQLRGQRHQLG
jgi:Ca2+-transporting ATPase